ncbi:transcription termination factor, mitochondrial isoform X2 [Harpegnathos saltator]|nr:transcription termination factor, mitochondrial isoform X2 [Harpegnathos saltator]
MIQTLKEILNTSTYETNKIITAYPQLKKKSRANVLNNYYNLLEAGVQKNVITKNIWLLAHDVTKLKEKLDCISTLKMNNEELLPLLRLTQDELVNNINYVQTDSVPYGYNKIEYLAYKLECGIEELCKLTVRCSFLLRIPVSYIDKKLNVLYEYNISNKNILKDLWVLRYSENHIRHRCELYKDTGNLDIKTWAIRCPLRVVKRAIHKNYVTRDLLQHHDNISDYLLNKLKVKEEELKVLTSKWPNVLRVHPMKLNKLINILHETGITSNDIIRTGGLIFHFNTENVQKRIEILNKKNIPVQISTLKLSEQLFHRYIEKKEKSERRELLLEFYQNNKGYLMYKLNVNEKTIDDFFVKWPQVTRVDILKLKELLDMLYQYNFTHNEILTHGRIFYFKIETLRKRIEILIEAGLTPKITRILFSKDHFDNFVRSHKIK